MPLESHHKLSVRKKQQKSSVEKPNTETIRERVRAILNREKNEGRNKIMQESRDNRSKLKELLARNTPDTGARREKKQDKGSDWTYQGLGGISVKNDEGTVGIRAAGLTFGNNKGKIVFGATHLSQRDMP